MNARQTLFIVSITVVLSIALMSTMTINNINVFAAQTPLTPPPPPPPKCYIQSDDGRQVEIPCPKKPIDRTKTGDSMLSGGGGMVLEKAPTREAGIASPSSCPPGSVLDPYINECLMENPPQLCPDGSLPQSRSQAGTVPECPAIETEQPSSLQDQVSSSNLENTSEEPQ